MQVPRGLHSGVNSPRSDALLDVTAMNDLLDMWSLPWHALQRRLAVSIGAAAGVQTPRPVAAGGADTGSWLMRALSAAPPQPNSRLE